MFINDLEYLEVADSQDLVQGGLQQVSVASSSASGISDTGSININASTFSNTSSGFSDLFFRSGPSTSASGFASASTSPLPPFFFPF